TNIHAAIEEKLQAFDPVWVEVLNESYMHSVPVNSQTHFKVTLVSNAFDGVKAVKRHQMLYAALQNEMQAGIHAMALHLYTPEEWSQRESSPQSPNCLGGGKS